MNEPAQWDAEGEPVNLPAAAADAAEWLDALADTFGKQMTRASLTRLGWCRARLREKLTPHPRAAPRRSKRKASPGETPPRDTGKLADSIKPPEVTR